MVEELALASMYGFVVRQPSEISGAKMRKPNVITIGQALFHGLRELRSDHVLFLEKDFALVESVPKPKLHAELLGASAMLLSHASVVYLRSRTEQGCDSFAPCGRPFVPRGGSWATRNNWWNFYCSSFHRPGRVADCLARSSDVTRAGTGDSSTPRSLSGDAESPGFRCHTSEDANWSLNAAMLNRTAVLERPLCVGGSSASGKCSTTIGHLAEESHDRQVSFQPHSRAAQNASLAHAIDSMDHTFRMGSRLRCWTWTGASGRFLSAYLMTVSLYTGKWTASNRRKRYLCVCSPQRRSHLSSCSWSTYSPGGAPAL